MRSRSISTIERAPATEVVAERIQFYFEVRLTGEMLTQALEQAERGRSRRPAAKKKAARKATKKAGAKASER